MTRWKLTIEYDGTDFCGWQKQINAVSVQQTLEQAIQSFCGEVVTLHTAGRTDTGVHARAQVAHFDCLKDTNGDVVRDAINAYLRPHKIAILKAEEVDQKFHARFSALQRKYRYRIVNRRAPLTFQSHFAWHIIKPLDISAMQAAADTLLGTHDFTTFRAQDCQANSPIRTLDKLDISKEGEEVVIATEARSFLYHQVRNMVGTLVLVGVGKWSVEEFQLAFAAKDRVQGGPTAPPQGLCFWEVTYSKISS
jgi:tRNA pseudouridine38-40 synthase